MAAGERRIADENVFRCDRGLLGGVEDDDELGELGGDKWMGRERGDEEGVSGSPSSLFMNFCFSCFRSRSEESELRECATCRDLEEDCGYGILRALGL